MPLKLDSASAKSADNVNTAINEAGKYIGTITRAEKLLSQRNTEGLGLSFRSSTGQTADYLDLYTVNSNGEILSGAKIVNALLACLRLREVKDGMIRCEKWNADAGRRESIEVNGYPELMGKRIGLLLQTELGTHSRTGADTKRMTIFGVFSADTELTASEILDGKTNPERLPRMVEALAARPVRDNRAKGARPAAPNGNDSQGAPRSSGYDPADDDIPF